MEEDRNEKLKKILSEIPERKKYVQRLRRLWDLAKTAPFAGVNMDFLDLMAKEIEKLEGEVQLAEMIAEVVKEKPDIVE